MTEIHAAMPIIGGISDSNCSKSNAVFFYNIPPLLGPFLSILTPPDAEIVFIYKKSFPVPVAIKISFNVAIK